MRKGLYRFKPSQVTQSEFEVACKNGLLTYNDPYGYTHHIPPHCIIDYERSKFSDSIFRVMVERQ